MQTAVRRRVLAAALGSGVIAITVGACDALTDPDQRETSLSFHVTTPAAQTGTAVTVTGTNGRTVVINAVDVVVSEITFEGRDVDVADDDDSDADSDSEHEGNLRFRAGANTIALPLDGGVITPFNGLVPAGTYDRLELDVEFARIQGTVDGQAFDVTVQVNRELEVRFSPPLVVDGATTPLNVSVNVDVGSWFTTPAGAAIDPRQLATDATMREEFRQRVKASFKAFEDEDRDADEDDSDSDSEEGDG